MKKVRLVFYLFFFFRAPIKVKVAEKSQKIVKARLKNDKEAKAVLSFCTYRQEQPCQFFFLASPKNMAQDFEAKNNRLSLEPARIVTL